MKKIISYIFILMIIGAVGAYLFFSKQNPIPNFEPDPKMPLEADEVGDGMSKFKILAVGDSLTAGYDLPLKDSYPKILEDKLLKAGKNVEVVNAGISGETTAGLLERAKFISEQNPDLLLITIGGNDAFRNLPLKNTKENIQKALQIFKQNVESEDIYLLQIEASANLGLKYRNEFNGMYKEIAKLENINLLPFVVREVFFDADKMLPDSIHPNRKGYEFIVDKFIFPAISKKMD